MRIQAPLVSTIQCNSLTSSALTIKAAATTSSLTLPLSRRRCLREIARCTTARSPATFAKNTFRCLPTSSMRARISIRRWRLCRLRLIHLRLQAPMHSLVPPASVCRSRIRLIRSLLQMQLFQVSSLRLQIIPPVVSQSRPGFGSAALTTQVHGAKNSPIGISCSTLG